MPLSAMHVVRSLPLVAEYGRPTGVVKAILQKVLCVVPTGHGHTAGLGVDEGRYVLRQVQRGPAGEPTNTSSRR